MKLSTCYTYLALIALCIVPCTITHAQTTTATVAPMSPVTPASKTVIKDKAAHAKLLGDHKISLQWISWDNFGTATVTEKDGVLSIEGEHKGGKQNPTDFLTIKGTITEVDELTFTFDGTIVTQITHIAKGEPVTRSGVYTFAVTKNRPYWRLREMNNPKDGVVDYVDIYFRKTAAAATTPASAAPKKPKK